MAVTFFRLTTVIATYLQQVCRPLIRNISHEFGNCCRNLFSMCFLSGTATNLWPRCFLGVYFFSSVFFFVNLKICTLGITIFTSVDFPVNLRPIEYCIWNPNENRKWYSKHIWHLGRRLMRTKCSTNRVNVCKEQIIKNPLNMHLVNSPHLLIRRSICHTIDKQT